MTETIVTSQTMRDDYVAVDEVDLRDTPNQDSEKYKLVGDLLTKQIADTPSVQVGYEEKPFYPFP